MVQEGRRKKKSGENNTGKKEAEAPKRDAEIRINWDESQMRTSYANVCNVSNTREEFTLLFGTNQTWQTGQGSLNVQLTNRVILNTFAAKRLSILLSMTVKEYEAGFGELNLDISAPGNSGKPG